MNKLKPKHRNTLLPAVTVSQQPNDRMTNSRIFQGFLTVRKTQESQERHQLLLSNLNSTVGWNTVICHLQLQGTASFKISIITEPVIRLSYIRLMLLITALAMVWHVEIIFCTLIDVSKKHKCDWHHFRNCEEIPKSFSLWANDLVCSNCFHVLNFSDFSCRNSSYCFA